MYFFGVSRIQAIQTAIDKAERVKMAVHSVLEGYLKKKGGRLGTWKERYFVLFNHQVIHISIVSRSYFPVFHFKPAVMLRCNIS